MDAKPEQQSITIKISFQLLAAGCSAVRFAIKKVLEAEIIFMLLCMKVK